MADIEETEHGSSGRMREWLARAARAARDPVWIADGIVSDEWLPASPLNGRLDAFKWEVPVERIGHRQDEAAPPILAAVEPEFAPAAGPVPLDLEPLELEPLELAPQEVVVIAQETPPADKPELAQKLAPEPAIEEKPAAEQAQVTAASLKNAPDREPAPARLVSLKSLPKGLVTAPDDPGPDAPDPLTPLQAPPPPHR
jgi:HemY protein